MLNTLHENLSMFNCWQTTLNLIKALYLNKMVLAVGLSLHMSTRIIVIPDIQIYVKLDIGDCYENLSTNSKFCAKQAQILGTLHETLITFYCCQLY